jgi:hypothetical protein|tara:strand:+ start:231 stop:356 length:126 start_codon:yes stop_codon:yes gene_type:complete
MTMAKYQGCRLARTHASASRDALKHARRNVVQQELTTFAQT